jgi:5-methyltetrahydrofolate--homocysteine methyltransferase
MRQPSFGTKIVEDIDVQGLFDLIDKDVLFASRWQLRGDLLGEEWQKRVEEVAQPAFNKVVELCISREIIRPKVVYGYFECKNNGNLLFVSHGNLNFKFDFPRERQSPNRCLADFFSEGFVTMQLVTIGGEVAKEGARLFGDHKYVDVFYLKGFAAEAAETLANFAQRQIAKELGFVEDSGVRFSFGYPSCPNLMDQKKLYGLLDAKRIGVALSRTMHLTPEHSTSAIISFDENAARFIP